MYEVKHIIQHYPANVIKDLEDILSGKIANNQDGVIQKFTADFGNGIEIDISVVGVPDDDTRGNSYVDCILVDDGIVVATADVSETLAGIDYHFEYYDNHYTLTIV